MVVPWTPGIFSEEQWGYHEMVVFWLGPCQLPTPQMTTGKPYCISNLHLLGSQQQRENTTLTDLSNALEEESQGRIFLVFRAWAGWFHGPLSWLGEGHIYNIVIALVWWTQERKDHEEHFFFFFTFLPFIVEYPVPGTVLGTNNH